MTAPVEEEYDLDQFDTSRAAGGENAEKIAAAKRVRFDRTELFKLDDGDQVVGRFLTDLFEHPDDPTIPVCLTVDMHVYQPTKEMPDSHEGKWPGFMDAVCRNDALFRGLFQKKEGALKGCYICDNCLNKKGKKSWPQPRTWGLIAMRKEVKENGKFVGTTTMTKEVTRGDKDDKDATTETVQDIRLIRQPYENFYSKVTSIGAMRENTMDQDFRISRKGSEWNNTRYDFTPYGVMNFDFKDPETGEVHKNIPFDLHNKKIRDAFFPKVPDLRRLIIDLAKDSFYERFWIPEHLQDSGGSSNGSVSSTKKATPAPNNDQDPAVMEALRNRALGASYVPADEQQSEEKSEASTLRVL